VSVRFEKKEQECSLSLSLSLFFMRAQLGSNQLPSDYEWGKALNIRLLWFMLVFTVIHLRFWSFMVFHGFSLNLAENLAKFSSYWLILPII